MRIAGHVGDKERLDVEFIRSVGMVARWVHEMVDPPHADGPVSPHSGPAG
ncbi:MAG: hypothetical protein KY455_00890 [Euryarchaeota archaeon]|nr:hypothetical protein [Euryarchaeota archaeon]